MALFRGVFVSPLTEGSMVLPEESSERAPSARSASSVSDVPSIVAEGYAIMLCRERVLDPFACVFTVVLAVYSSSTSCGAENMLCRLGPALVRPAAVFRFEFSRNAAPMELDRRDRLLQPAADDKALKLPDGDKVCERRTRDICPRGGSVVPLLRVRSDRPSTSSSSAPSRAEVDGLKGRLRTLLGDEIPTVPLLVTLGGDSP